MDSLTLVIAVCISVVTGVVTYHVLRSSALFASGALPIAVCGGILAGLGLLHMGPGLLFICIPWTALGLAVLLIPLIRALFRAPGKGYTDKPKTEGGDLSSPGEELGSRPRRYPRMGQHPGRTDQPHLQPGQDTGPRRRRRT